MKTQINNERNRQSLSETDPGSKKEVGSRTLHDCVYRNPIRAILCILYAAAAFLILSRFGFLPRILSLPQRDGSIAVNSVFYYTGNSFNNLVQNANEKRIPSGTIDKLDLFSATNYDGGGYYAPEDNTFYFNRSNYVYSFRAPVEKGRKELEYIDNKSIAGNRRLQYDYAIPLGDIYIHLGRKQSVLAHARGTHSLYGKSFNEDNHTLESVGDILLRNKTEKITFNEFLKVLYFYSNDKLLYWNPDTGKLVWFMREDSADDHLHFIIYDVVNDLRQDHYSSAGIELSKLVFFPWDESHFIAVDNSTCELYKWDFVSQTTEYLTKLPSTQYYVFRILEDHTLVAALEEWNTGDIWFYRQSSDTLSKLSEGSGEEPSQNAAIAIGEDTIAVFEPFVCKYYSFREVQ